MPIRADAKRVKVSNSGLIVFLYDAAHTAALDEAHPSLLDGFSEAEALADPTQRRVAEQGQLVAYELQQDDDLQLEVVVGPPLSPEELGRARWHAPQRARLQLPSGKLHIDSYDTLRLGEETPMERGATVTVPPGDYVLSLYRVFREQLEVDGIRGYRGPQEILVLSAGADAPPLKQVSPLLVYPQTHPTAPWSKRYVLGTGMNGGAAVRGEVVAHDKERLVLNVDREAGATLDLRYGAALTLRAGKKAFPVAFLGERPLDVERYLEAGGVSPAGLRGAWWERDRLTQEDLLAVQTPPGTRWKAGAAVELEREPGVHLAPAPLLSRPWMADGKMLHAVVGLRYLSQLSLPSFLLNLDAEALAAIGAEPGNVLSIRVADVVRPLHLFASTSDRIGAIYWHSKPPEGTFLRLNALMEEYTDTAKGEAPDREARLADLWGAIEEIRRADGYAEIPCAACLVEEPSLGGVQRLEVQPMRGLGSIHVMHPAFDFPFDPGTPVVIHRSGG